MPKQYLRTVHLREQWLLEDGIMTDQTEDVWGEGLEGRCDVRVSNGDGKGIRVAYH